jgi:hypothetical protein
MASYAIEPVTLVVKLVASKATEGGLVCGFTDVEVLSANGEADPRFYGFANPQGFMVLNYKSEGRPTKPAKADKPAPKALTAADKAMIPGPATKPVKGGKAKPAAAPAAPVQPDMAQMFAMFQQFMAAQK